MMKRIDFRKLKVADKLLYLREAVEKGYAQKTITGYIDECIYCTGKYMRGTTKRITNLSKEEIIAKREAWRKDNIRTNRADAIKKANEALKECKDWKYD